MSQSKKDQATESAQTAAETQATQAIQGSDLVEELLDLDHLDLSVEAIDERISPSETNVFDK
ncbi:MAG: hypothetical protein H6829_00975 [Planctomycetes bacterium]|nr:hypothetical protein [Planctomycetota bacterium]MCB9912356.1 hypothetical protein [Planctomycetota bacterium]HPF13734.1 hypothetical protein [Planctomycetota bacterium]